MGKVDMAARMYHPDDKSCLRSAGWITAYLYVIAPHFTKHWATKRTGESKRNEVNQYHVTRSS
jgi:hypothetical protein